MTSYPASFCPDCGTGLVDRAVDGRERRFCEACERVVWHNPAPCAGVAVVGAEGVLLAQRDVAPGRGRWGVPGGHLEADEPAPVAAARELEEETGVRVDADALSLLDCFHASNGDGKYVVSVGYVVHADRCAGTATVRDEVQAVGRFTPETLAASDAVLWADHVERFHAAWDWFRSGP
ncbi:NUDIX hydrolase [Haloarchaeobius baliensis]|uniref:NUDIX hydrolase n=1 Tax=Haloarchaeobius baliensis TaxID=1670458 RepID=UPI003F884DE5